MKLPNARSIWIMNFIHADTHKVTVIIIMMSVCTVKRITNQVDKVDVLTHRQTSCDKNVFF